MRNLENAVLVFFFLAYFTLYNRIQFHPSHQNWFKWILYETGANYTEWSKPERKTPIRYTNKHIYMEFRKMVTITLYVRQQKRHRCIEQCFGLCGRGQGWNDLGEWHLNMYIIICETNCQSRFDAWDRVLGAGALGWPRGMGWRWVQDGEHMYTHGRFKSMYGKTNTIL